MIKMNCLYRRLKDDVRVVTLEDQRTSPTPRGSYGRMMHDWIAVRYVGSGRKGYLKADDLEGADYDFLGHVNPAEIWGSSPLRRDRTPDNDLTAAAEHDLREREIVKLRKRIIDGHFYGHQPVSQSAVGAMEQAIHMILAGV